MTGTTAASRLTAGVLGRTLDSIPPAAGAEVMGTGIVSTALSLDGQETLSRVILVIGAVIWVTPGSGSWVVTMLWLRCWCSRRHGGRGFR